MLLTYRKCFVLHRGMESNKSEKLTCTPVKCTYCLKDTALQQYINKYNSCLKSENGDASLKREHAYYYQTQRLESFTVTLLFVVFVSKLISSVKEFCLMSATGTLLFPT